MKTLRLVLEFFSRNKLPTIIVTVIFTVSLLFANYNVALYRYITYTRDLLVSTETENSIYCMPTRIEDKDEMNDVTIDRIENKAKKYKAYTAFKRTEIFSAIVNGSVIENLLFTQEMIDEYKLPISNGSLDALREDGGEYFNAVVSGKRFDYLNVGDTLDMTIYDHPNQIIKVKIVGSLANPDIVPSFTHRSSSMNANKLYEYFDGLIFLKTDNLVDTMNNIAEYNVPCTQCCFMTAYKEGASEAEKAEYYSFLDDNAGVVLYDEILNNTNAYVDKSLREAIPTPLFLVIIVTLSLLSLPILFVNKKLREHSIYYLCGCCRVKSCFIISCAIAFMGLAGGLINILFIANYEFLSKNGIVNMGDGLIYDGYSMLFTLLYALAVSIVSVIISLLIFSKSSPIEIYRKFEA